MKAADRQLLRQRVIDIRETLDRCYKSDSETMERRAALNEAALNTIISSLVSVTDEQPRANLQLATINELVAELASRFKEAPKSEDSPDSGEHHQ